MEARIPSISYYSLGRAVHLCGRESEMEGIDCHIESIEALGIDQGLLSAPHLLKGIPTPPKLTVGELFVGEPPAHPFVGERSSAAQHRPCKVASVFLDILGYTHTHT